jgi:hypothetical protein
MRLDQFEILLLLKISALACFDVERVFRARRLIRLMPDPLFAKQEMSCSDSDEPRSALITRSSFNDREANWRSKRRVHLLIWGTTTREATRRYKFCGLPI